MMFTKCPSCQGEIKFTGRPHMSQQVRCRNCDAQLEVVWLNPIELDWVEVDDYVAKYDRNPEYEFEYGEEEDREDIEEEADPDRRRKR